MSLRWQFERTGRFKVPYKVEIYDSEYSGSVQTLDKVGADPVTLVMGTQNADPLDKIKASYISVEFVGKTGDFEDLFSRDNQRFLFKLFIDGDFYSEFIPVTNEFSDTVTEGVYTNSIRCANLAVLKQVKIKEIFTTDERISKLEGLHRIVTHLFDMDVVDGSILYPSGANTNASALTQIDFNTGRFDDQTAYEALQWLTPKMHQLRVWDGAVFMIPVNEASFTGYRYNGSSITSSVYNDNFTGIFKGGRLGIDREKLRVYDSVLRNYEPGEAPNIVPNGDLDDLENFTYTTAPIGNLRLGLPNGWTIAQGDTPWLIRNTGIESDPYRGEINVGNSIYEALTDIEIIEDQNLRVNVDVEFNSSRDVVWCLPVKVKVGDYVAQIDYGIDGSRLVGTGELSWELESEVDIPFLFVLGNSDRIINFSQQLPPLPLTGTASFQVASPLPFLNIVTDYNQNVDPEDRAFLYNFALDAVDEEGDIILRSETEAGESGDVYEYTEQFGDGFTSVNPGALFFNGEQTLNWSVKGYSGTGSLSSVQVSYLLSELSRDRDRISGNVDTFDTIALIEGKRVNYISTNFRKGNSKIELVEIVPHDLDATTEERRGRGGGGGSLGGGGTGTSVRPDIGDLRSIGMLTETINEESRTSIEVDLSNPAKGGFEYWIVNEAELSRNDLDAGVYPIIPDIEDPSETGEFTLAIEEQVINAPEGSLIYMSSSQDVTNWVVFEEENEFINDQLAINTSAIQTISSVIDVELEDIEAISESITELQATVDLFEDDIAINTGAIDTLQTRVTVTEGEIEANSTAVTAVQAGIGSIENRIDGSFEVFDDSSEIWNTFNEFFLNGIPVNSRGIFFLDARVSQTEDKTEANATSLIGISSEINDIEEGLSATATAINSLETRVTQTEDTIEVNAQAILGVESRLESGGFEFEASAFLSLETNVTEIDGEVTNISAKAALVVDAGGAIGSINLSADGLTGFSKIDIQASQVQINQVLFDDDGMIRSESFDGAITDGVATTLGTTGWSIDRSGQIVAHNIRIRGGDIEGIDLRGNVGNIQIFETEGDLPVGSYASGDAVEEGDVAYVKTKPDSLYRFDGDDWISTVDGEDILANSIVAGKLNVATLSAIAAEVGNLTVGATESGGSIVMRENGVIRNETSGYQITDTGITISDDALFDITMGSGGVIKNTGGEYQIGADGINLLATDLDTSGAFVEWKDSLPNGTIKARLRADTSAFNRFLISTFDGMAISINSDSILELNGNVTEMFGTGLRIGYSEGMDLVLNSEPPTPPADSVRLFSQTITGVGRALRVKFPNGNVVTLASE